jgi:hypothetical protein
LRHGEGLSSMKVRMTRPPDRPVLSQQILRARKRFFRPVSMRSRASFFLTSRIAKAAAMIFAVVITLWPLRAGRLSARRVAQRAGANAAFHARTHTRDYAEWLYGADLFASDG